ncbi:efflux RND transporter periplasmic adaptor subunit [Xanthomonas hyacinthi]|nr:HlyD family efflux transporter periplasmic adaptor subunit [Xanthomonas hyacinthi]
MDKPRQQNNSARKRKKLIVISSVLSTVLLACMSAFWKLSDNAPQVARNDITVGTVQRGSLSRTVRASGRLVSAKMLWLTARTTARVDKIVAPPGTEVLSTTQVIRLTNPGLEESYRAASSTYAAARDGLDAKIANLKLENLNAESELISRRSEHKILVSRIKAEERAYEKQVISRLEYNTSITQAEELSNQITISEKKLAGTRAYVTAQVAAERSRVAQLEGERNLRRAEVDALSITAGMDGIVQQIAVEEGQQIEAGANLARIAERGQLIAELRVPESLSFELALGQEVKVETRSGEINGLIRRINPRVDKGAILVEVSLSEQRDASLRSDQSVDGIIQIEKVPNTTFIERPQNALPGEKMPVYRLKGENMAERVEVTYGKQSSDTIEVRGLAAGDKIILSDTSQFEDANKLKIK